MEPNRKKFDDEDERKNEEKAQLKAKKGGKLKQNEVAAENKTNIEYERYDFEEGEFYKNY